MADSENDSTQLPWNEVELEYLLDPEDTIREALRDYVGDGEGLDEEILARFASELKAAAVKEVAEEFRDGGSAIQEAIYRKLKRRAEDFEL